ncbi:MAG: MBL fold metallo-hydrolase [Alphaproteobacteria bacterium]
MRITVLGCGSSAGVPLIGCECAVCCSDNPKNQRSRVSVLVENLEKKLLIDASPDLRLQALRHGITRVDAVLFTHEHADHTHGIDDLRSFNHSTNADLPVYGDTRTLQSLTQRFDYAFKGKPKHGWFRPSLAPMTIPDGNVVRFSAAGLDVVAFTQVHGKTTSLGFRIGDFAYSTDTNELPDTAFEALQGTRCWVVDCLKYEPSFSHSHLDRTLAWIARIKPQRAVLTHMTHDFDYERLAAELPDGIEPGYDGLILDL